MVSAIWLAGKVGSEAQASHYREGEAGCDVLLGGTIGGTERPQTVPPNSSKVRRVVIATCGQHSHAPNGVSPFWLATGEGW